MIAKEKDERNRKKKERNALVLKLCSVTRLAFETTPGLVGLKVNTEESNHQYLRYWNNCLIISTELAVINTKFILRHTVCLLPG